MKIWDSHTHLFPPEVFNNIEKYAAKNAFFAALCTRPPGNKGTEQIWRTPEQALVDADAAGVWGFVLQGVFFWDDVGLQRMNNDFIAETFQKYPDRIKGYAGVNLTMGAKACIEEIERCAKLGFVGVGELHTGANQIGFDDPIFIEVAECAQDMGLVLCAHCSAPVSHKFAGSWATPLAPIPDLVKRLPKLKLQLAHLGGGMPFFETSPKYDGLFENVYYDFAANPLTYGIRVLRGVIDMVGADRVMFGSDYSLTLYPYQTREPGWDMFVNDIRDNAGMTEEEWNKVMGENLLRFIG